VELLSAWSPPMPVSARGVYPGPVASASPRSADAPDDLTMVEGASLPPLAPGADRAGTAGVLLGRYVIIEHAGSGAMGSVLRAYDPRLHREVAIKRVHASRRDPAAQRRLLREAQAMAQLSHPHTVAVYDVEPSDEGIYFAMEYVPGGTLEQWLAKRPRTLPEILAVMRQAGEGLAAAHAADLVHRDFKPTNVLVTEDGRAKVTDFGLAKPAASHDSSSSCPSPAADDQLTLAGTVMGTPRYMAPEQHMGADADARADQYAWCVTLWEVLAGAPPFAGKSVQELAAGKLAGPPSWPRARPIPGPLLAAIRRGLCIDPADRWPSMAALLAAVERFRVRARRRRIAAVGLGGLVIVGGLLGGRAWQRQRAVASCEAAGQEIAAVWPGRSDALLDGLVQVDPRTATATAERAAPWLDAWAAQWSAARTEVCMTTEVSPTLPAALGPRALGCLDASRTQIEAVIDAVAAGEPSAAQGAVAAFAAPTELDACTDPVRLEQTPWPTVDQSEAVAALRRQLAHAAGLRLAGRYEPARDEVEAVRREAEGLGFRPLVVEAELALGGLFDLRAEYSPAVAHLRAAFFEAASVGMDRVALEAAARLVLTVGVRLARHDEGIEWAEHARVYAARLGDAAQLSSASLWGNEAAVRRLRGELDAAIRLHEQALELRERILGPEHPDVATTRSNLALVVADTGDLARARRLHEDALASRERALGPEHPNVASSLDNLGGVARALGEHETARALHERALGIWERTVGPDHPGVAVSLSSLAVVHLRLGDRAAATRAAERALAIRERALGLEHPDVAMTLDVLASLRWSAGRRDEAIAMSERSLAIRQQALGPTHPHVAASLVNLAGKHRRLEQWDQARTRYEQALAIGDETRDAAQPHVLEALAGLAELALDEPRPAQAQALRPRLRALVEAGALEPRARGRVEFLVARIHWQAGEREPARAAAERARAAYGEVGGTADDAEDAAEVAAWIAERFGAGG
jgi:tetratricopeptide (TPR) repeat protein